jgi:hypothetical protein
MMPSVRGQPSSRGRRTLHSLDDQLLGLDELAKWLTHTHRINLKLKVGDVTALMCGYPQAQLEVVYVAGGYDVWRSGGELLQTNLSKEGAAEILLREYIELKTGIIVRREFRGRKVVKSDIDAIRRRVADYTRGANG